MHAQRTAAAAMYSGCAMHTCGCTVDVQWMYSGCAMHTCAPSSCAIIVMVSPHLIAVAASTTATCSGTIACIPPAGRCSRPALIAVWRSMGMSVAAEKPGTVPPVLPMSGYTGWPTATAGEGDTPGAAGAVAAAGAVGVEAGPVLGSCSCCLILRACGVVMTVQVRNASTPT